MMAIRDYESADISFLHLFNLLSECDPVGSAYVKNLEKVRNSTGK